VLSAGVVLALACGVFAPAAHTQLTPTPGQPSLPLLAPGVAGGVQNRITYQHGIEFATISATKRRGGQRALAARGGAGRASGVWR
jgi:hypothetical protein